MLDQSRVPVGCVVMAAGNASRFGKNKLLAEVGGKTLIERALDAVPADTLSAVCVVTQYDEIEELARRYGFDCIRNDRPDLGASHTVRLGTEALRERCGAILFQVSDQPFLQRETVAALIALYEKHPDRITCLASGGVRGNPCVFPAALFPELGALTGDKGGAAVIRRCPERVLLMEADPRELRDVDTQAALDALPGI